MSYEPKHSAGRRPGVAAPRTMTGAAVTAALLSQAAAAHASAGEATSSTGLPDILLKIRYCESSGNYTAQNPSSTASGAFQFLDSTWRGIPGTQGYSRAKYAPASVQNRAAEWLYNQAGTSPWLASKPCWSKLGSAPGGVSNTGGASSGTSGSSSGKSSGSGSSKGSTKSGSGKSAPTKKPVVKKPVAKKPVAKPVTKKPAATTAPTHQAPARKATPAHKPASAHQPAPSHKSTQPLAKTPAQNTSRAGSHQASAPTTATTSTVPAGAPALGSGWHRFPEALTPLNSAQKIALASATGTQKQQTWWTPEAAAGANVTRTVVTAPGHPGVTHVAPHTYSASVGYVANGQQVVGHYVNPDWFQIVLGPQAGQFVSSAKLQHTDAPVNGQLNEATQLVKVPSYLVLDGAPVYLQPTAAKALIRLDAAMRAATGQGIQIIDGYRTTATQAALIKQFGAASCAPVGTSNHGMGLAIGVNGGNFSAASATWVDSYARGFGWRLAQPASTQAYTSTDFIG